MYTNAITWAQLFGVGFIVAGLATLGLGALAVFAGGMSDAPEDGESASSAGCLIALGGFVLTALGIWMVR